MTKFRQHISLLIIMTLGFQKTFCQRQFPEPADTKIASLKKDKVDTILVYHNYVDGGKENYYEKGDTNCHSTDLRVIFWVKRGQYFKQKFEYCKDFPEQKLTSSRFIKLACDSLKSIKRNQIEPVVYHSIDKKGKPIIVEASESHSEITKFTFIFGKSNFQKSINHHSLDTEKFETGQVNENYQRNQNSILKKLKDDATKEL